MHSRIGKKIQLQNGNNSKWKMKNGNKSPIINENPIWKMKIQFENENKRPF